MSSFGDCGSLVLVRHEGIDQSWPGVLGENDIINIAQFCSLKWVGEVISVFLNQSRPGRTRIVRISDLFSKDNVGCPSGPMTAISAVG